MRTHDVSAQPKTGEALLNLVVEDIKWSEDTYGLEIIAACSDDGGDARRMRRLLLALMPWLIIILCWAHQINLIVGDYLSLKLPFQNYIQKTLMIILKVDRRNWPQPPYKIGNPHPQHRRQFSRLRTRV